MIQGMPFVRVGVVIAALFCAAGALADPPATETQMLLYCDQSAGAMLYLTAWQGLAVTEGSGHTTVTNADTFANHLDNSTWQSVTVLACYTETEPAYVASLRAYMQSHPETRTTLLLWHTQGVTPPPHTYVVATTACVFWYLGMTGVGYAMDATPGGFDPNSGIAYVGYVWPDFTDIVVREWRVVRPSPVFDGPVPSPGGTGYDDCIAQCENKLREQVTRCWNDLKDRVAQCEKLYGVSAIQGSDPIRYADCVRRKLEHAGNCLEGAAQQYDECVLVCEQEHAGMQGN